MKLEDVIKQGWKIEIETVVKRLGDLNNRYWESRVTYKAIKDEYKVESDWEGFINPNDAIQDMCKKVESI